MRYEQYQVVENPAFRGMVEASVMVTAYAVLNDTDHENYEQRASLARTLFHAATPRQQVESIIRLFTWYAVNDATVIQQYQNNSGNVAAISDEAMDNAVAAFWDTVAGVVEGEEV